MFKEVDGRTVILDDPMQDAYSCAASGNLMKFFDVRLDVGFVLLNLGENRFEIVEITARLESSVKYAVKKLISDHLDNCGCLVLKTAQFSPALADFHFLGSYEQVLSIEVRKMNVHSDGFEAYIEERRRIYVDELHYITNEQHAAVSNAADMYGLFVNGYLAGGCRFYRLTTDEYKRANGLDTDRDYLLMGKIFTLPRFRGAGFCTHMLRHAIAQYPNESLTILSYAHLQDYYSGVFGFQPVRWFIEGLCMIMQTQIV